MRNFENGVGRLRTVKTRVKMVEKDGKGWKMVKK